MSKEIVAEFKANNYGEVLAVLNDLELVSYEEDGGYQGEYKVILTDGNRDFYFFGSYGSCSGCDWLEDVRDWDNDTVPYKLAKETYGDLKPTYIVPKNMKLKFNKEAYDGFKLRIPHET